MSQRDDSTSAVTANALRELAFFDGMSDEHLSAVAAIARREHISAGADALTESEPARDPRVVLSGRLALTLRIAGRDDLVVSTLARGELLGWSALIPNRTWVASAIARGDASLVAIDGPALRALCDADSELGYRVIKAAFRSVATRLADTRLQLVDMFGSDG